MAKKDSRKKLLKKVPTRELLRSVKADIRKAVRKGRLAAKSKKK